GRGGQKLLQHRRANRDLLKVVDHKQKLELTQMGLKALNDRDPGRLRYSQRASDAGGYQDRIRDRGEVDKERAGPRFRQRFSRDLEVDAGLASSTPPREGEGPRPPKT